MYAWRKDDATTDGANALGGPQASSFEDPIEHGFALVGIAQYVYG